MNNEANKYTKLFLEESNENLEKLNDCLLELEKNPEDNTLINEIFRSAHTMKGMAATMGYNQMSDLTHHMENVLELFRKGEISITSDIISLLFQCLDKLSEMITDIAKGKLIEYQLANIFNQLDSVKSQKLNLEKQDNKYNNKMDSTIELNDYDWTVIRNAHSKNFSVYNIIVELSRKCLLKSARAYLVLNRLEEKGEIIKSKPSVEQMEEENFEQSFQLIYISNLSMEEVEEKILNISEIQNVEISIVKPKQNSNQEVAITQLSEDLIEDKTIKNFNSHNQLLNQSIRVDLSKLDNIMNLVSELVIYRTRLEDLSTKYRTTEINEPLEQVARITSNLQDLVLKIRMQPIGVVFNRFPRMVRDLSKELGKEIDLIIEGEDTELDRTVVNELGEPLVHLIRNAVDHGIELPEDRCSSGKKKSGQIIMKAYQEGNKVIININDDGKGINPDKIREVAIKKGIDTEGLDDQELIQLIFAQGFSTKQEITNVSGRGVGMDAVKEKITSLGGNIEVHSEINKGTSFIIKLPLTLSIIQSLLVNVGTETFAISLGFIEKVLSVELNDIIKSHNEEIYIYRGKTLPVIKINEKLNINELDGMKHIIIVTVGGKNYGLLVDNLIGQQEIVIKDLGLTLKNMKEYVGATILGDGRVILILDVGNICTNRKDDRFEH